MFVFLVVAARSANYAVLVAGSNTYKNYRHQADVFRMAKVLESRKFNPDHIVVLAYNDIVDHLRNPFQGRVFSLDESASVFPGKEIRRFVHGEDVTVDKFYDILLGKTDLLKLKKEDNLLIYFCDHGAAGMLVFPTTYVFADELRDVFTRMSFNHALFVIEACQSGSVGEVLNDVPGLTVITAANAVQSSYACGWSDRVQAFVTNEFSAHMFDYLERTPDATVMDLYENCKTMTKRSNVMVYGDEKVCHAKLSTFFGKGKKLSANYVEPDLGVSVNANAVFPGTLQMKMRGKTGSEIEGLQFSFASEIQRRKSVQNRFARISNAFGERVDTTEKVEITNWTCYRNVVCGVEKTCGKYDESSMPNIRLFAKLCNGHRETDILQVASYVCEPEKYSKYRRTPIVEEPYRQWKFE